MVVVETADEVEVVEAGGEEEGVGVTEVEVLERFASINGEENYGISRAGLRTRDSQVTGFLKAQMSQRCAERALRERATTPAIQSGNSQMEAEIAFECSIRGDPQWYASKR